MRDGGYRKRHYGVAIEVYCLVCCALGMQLTAQDALWWFFVGALGTYTVDLTSRLYAPPLWERRGRTGPPARDTTREADTRLRARCPRNQHEHQS
jgi:hypothetical protein